MAVHFLNLNRADFLKEYARIYRFSTIERTIDILKNKNITFINPTKWVDPFEKFFLERNYLIGNCNFSLPLKDNAFALCVSATSNSEAYWNIYAPKEDGIRLTFNTEMFLEYFLDKIRNADIYIGKVDYQITNDFHNLTIDKNKLINEIKNLSIGEQQINLLLKKRTAFYYENEIRIIIIPKYNVKDNDFLNLRTDIMKYTENFTLDPRIGSNHVKILKEYFKNNFGIKVSHSKLYSDLKRKPIRLSECKE